jgi:uncharacterized protein YacL
VVIPYIEFARQVRGTRPLLLDTSVLVDGRIEDLGRTGIVDAPVIVPAFVIDELQALADSGDAGKRQRGRRGLDVLQRLQANPFLDVEIEEFRAEGRSTDRALVEVARDERFRVVTLDSGLEKVAQINGVPVLNLAAVSAAMRPGQSSGDGMRIELVKRGEAPHQGVGFLEDGTMVVVDHGAGRVGDSVDVVVTNTVQTSAGRLVFARLAHDGGDDDAKAPPEAPAPDHEPAAQAGDAPAAHSAVESMARAATAQPRTPPRPGHEPSPSRRARNPRR